MHRTIRWGILGTGLVARDFARGLGELSDVRLVAVGSRTRANAEAFAGAFGVPRTYANYMDLVEDEEVDAVYVATPASLHRDHCLLALSAGRAVLCEKPFTTSAVEAREVIVEARQRGLFCMEAMWMRFLPAMLRLRELLDRGTIGDVRLLTADLGFAARNTPGNRLFDPALGGGAFLDLGVYLVSLACWLFGRPDQIVAQASVGSTGVDEDAGAILHYPGGELAVLTTSLRNNLPGEALILGTRGQIRIHTPIYRPHRLSLRCHVDAESAERTPRTNRSRLNWARNNRLLRSVYFQFERFLRPLLQGRSTGIVAPFSGNGYQYEAQEVARCLRAGATESQVMPLDETLLVMETLDQIRAAWTEAAVHP